MMVSNAQNWQNFVISKSIKLGYNIVYTPHVANPDLLNNLDLNSFFIKSDNWHENFVFFFHKTFNHVAMFRENSYSYKDLPIKYLEIDELYENQEDKLTNFLGIYLTLFYLDSDSRPLLADFSNEDIVEIDRTVAVHKNSSLQYVGSDNLKHIPQVLSAKIKFRLK